MLAVFVCGGGTNCLKFTSCEHWLQDACCIDCTFCCACTDKCVDFVDEQHDVAAGLDFFQDFLQTLFKVTAVTRTCNKSAEVECVELLVFESLWNVAGNDALCETFNNCSLTNTWFTDENWVVLCATRENLHDALEFALTTNDGVELLVASKLCEVATELIENLAATLFARVFLRAT